MGKREKRKAERRRERARAAKSDRPAITLVPADDWGPALRRLEPVDPAEIEPIVRAGELVALRRFTIRR